MKKQNDILAGFETYVAPEEIAETNAADTPATSFPCVTVPQTGFWTIRIGC